MANLAIIPARGGSKRISKKNIKDFFGKPILAYSIEAALNSGLFDEVMVSTDSEEISSIAKSYGATVPFFRSTKNADDFATTSEVINEVIEVYQNNEKYFKYSCCIYPTAPFITSDILIDAYKTLSKNDFDSVFPVLEYSFPIQRAMKMDSQGKIKMITPEHLNTRSQDLNKSFHDAGQFYWFNVERFKDNKKIFTANSGGIILPETKVQDIDNEMDWKLAELKYQFINEN